MATDPTFTSVGVIGYAQISTANANRDGTGTIGTVVTGAAAGTRIDTVVIKGTVTTTAGTIRLFVYDGTNNVLIAEIPTVAITVSATQPGFEYWWTPPNGVIVLPSASWTLKASTEKAENYNVLALGGNLT